MRNPWNIELRNMPEFDKAWERTNAWLHGGMTDRPPIRFSRTNAEFEAADYGGRSWPTEKDRWMDAEFWVDSFIKSLSGKTFRAETFPCYWPNLGPAVFAACYECPYLFGDVTCWTEPMIFSYEDGRPAMNMDHPYIHKLEEMTRIALEKAGGRYIVGFTDILPGLDCLAGLRGAEPLLYDFIDRPDKVISMMEVMAKDFIRFYDHFDGILKAANQPSVAWINVPTEGKMHVPCCDASFMFSTKDFEKFVYPCLYRECEHMDYNIFHVDGKGVAKHLDVILTLPNIQAIQWVQGVGADGPMLQWVPFIKSVQARGKGVMVDITPAELDAFIDALSPEGLFLCMEAENEEQELAIIKRVERW